MSANTPPASVTEESCTPTQFTHSLGIDVRTKDSAKLRAALKRLPKVIFAVDGGVYREDAHYSQIHVLTLMTEDELDHWLFGTEHGCEVVGVFQR